MENMKRYELIKKDYIPVITSSGVSYGGSQQWFSDQLTKSKEARIHHNGCGLIAASDLFLYWQSTMKTMPQAISASQTFEEDGRILKEHYMTFVRYLGDRYIYILPKLGIPYFELVTTIQSYAWLHQLPFKVKCAYLINERAFLLKIIKMLKADIPVILFIGSPFPSVLYMTLLKNKEAGVTFYTEEQGSYTPVYTGVRAHYVTITGVIINKEASNKKDKVMLKIASWGETYYISYYEYCKYEMHYKADIQGGIIEICTV